MGAIVSVNLTAMLVLTTIFLGVSGDLPTTSYVKYVEIWLLFCLFVPFIYVLLHIYIDSLRDENGRTVNHHGGEKEAIPEEISTENIVKVSPADLISRDEIIEFEARKEFYENLLYTKKRAIRIGRLQF